MNVQGKEVFTPVVYYITWFLLFHNERKDKGFIKVITKSLILQIYSLNMKLKDKPFLHIPEE